MSTSGKETVLHHQGPLEKQGKIMKTSWKKYWFILHDDQLIYYKEDPKSKSSSRRTSSSSNQGEILLNQVLTIKENSNANHGYAFDVTTKSRNHVLSADTAEGRSTWVKLLQEAMTLKNRNSSLGEPNISCKSIGDVEEEDDGMYDPIDFNGIPQSRNSAHKSVTDIQISVTGEARCYSGVFDDNYSPVFDAHLPPVHHDDEDDETYAEVNDAVCSVDRIRESTTSENIAAYAQTPASSGPNQATSIPNMESQDVGRPQSTQDGANSRGSYSYVPVQMRKKTSMDYRKPAKTPSAAMSVDDYADVEYKNKNDDGYSETCNEVTVITDDRTSARRGSGNGKRDDVSVPYAQVLPKALRAKISNEDNNNVKAGLEGTYNEDYDDVCVAGDNVGLQGDVYDSIADYDADSIAAYDKQTFESHPDLQHPRLELTTASAFDKIRLFLAEHRGPNEVYKIPDDIQLDGYAIEKLKQLLKKLDVNKMQQRPVSTAVTRDVLRGGKPAVAEKRIQSTHL